MTKWLLVIAIPAVIAIAIFLAYRARTRARSFKRLPRLEPPDGNASDDRSSDEFDARPFPPRYRPIPWIVAVLVLASLLLFHLNPIYSIAIALMIGLLLAQAESSYAENRLILIETQLADAIDLMVSTLHAGGGVIVSIENASLEIGNPLRRYFSEMLSRIRYGEDPQEVVRRLPSQIPLETFRLFATALGIHWEVGGSLAPTLATVGRTVRDRIDISRRTRSLTAQARVSTVVLLVVTYFLAFLMWRHDPAEMMSFATSVIGRLLISATLVLQAVGIVWQSAISKPKF